VSGPRDDRGFTLLEILMVVGLLAAFTAVLASRMGGGFGVAIGGGGRVVASELRYAAQRAIATGRTHRWVIDVDSQAFRLEEQIEEDVTPADVREAVRSTLKPPVSAFSFVPVDTHVGSWRWFDDEAVRIDGVRVRRQYFDSGRVEVGFGEDGGAENALVYLGDSYEHVLGVRVTGFTSDVRIVEGEALADAETDLDLAEERLGAPLEPEAAGAGNDIFEDRTADEDEGADAPL
jgi:prepilin-type N-terminal cleavage/methylation domain-containing protein